MPRGVRGSGNAFGVATAAPKVSPAAPPVDFAASSKPLGSLDVDRLDGEHLKAYARRAGVSQRDVDGLTTDRLRQNVKLAITNYFDLITE